MLEMNQRNGTATAVVKQGTESSFAADVMEASKSVPVVAYFSASWCGPCKTFGPQLERAVADCAGKVTLVKFDADKCQSLVAQLGVQSVPMVFGFADGRPVDGFAGAQPPSQINRFLSQLAKLGKGDGIPESLEEAEKLLDAGAAVDAAQQFASILSQAPDNAAALGGMARAYLALGNIDSAEAIIKSAPEEISESREVAAARSAVSLALRAANTGPVDELRAKISADPNDHESRLQLSLALHANGHNAEAIEELLELFRRDREWKDGAAREQLMTILDSLKPNDPVALKGRRQFSSMIFS